VVIVEEHEEARLAAHEARRAVTETLARLRQPEADGAQALEDVGAIDHVYRVARPGG